MGENIPELINAEEGITEEGVIFWKIWKEYYYIYLVYSWNKRGERRQVLAKRGPKLHKQQARLLVY